MDYDSNTMQFLITIITVAAVVIIAPILGIILAIAEAMRHW